MIVSMLRVPTEFDFVKVKVTADGEKRIARLQAKGEFGSCLGCEREFTAQEIADGKKKCGQCETCYNGTLYAIRKRRTTRKRQCEQGKMLAPSPGGRRPANDYTRSLSESA